MAASLGQLPNQIELRMQHELQARHSIELCLIPLTERSGGLVLLGGTDLEVVSEPARAMICKLIYSPILCQAWT